MRTSKREKSTKKESSKDIRKTISAGDILQIKSSESLAYYHQLSIDVDYSDYAWDFVSKNDTFVVLSKLILDDDGWKRYLAVSNGDIVVLKFTSFSDFRIIKNQF